MINKTILYDDREKKPFQLEGYSLEKKRLSVGDYTIQGMEDIFVIERKGAPSEWSTNLFKEFERFSVELEALSRMPHSYIVCEFSADDILKYPWNSNLPMSIKKKIRISGKLLLARTVELQIIYRVPIILAGRNGENIARSIIEKVWEIEGGKLSEEFFSGAVIG
jgi:hypothetical protein